MNAQPELARSSGLLGSRPVRRLGPGETARPRPASAGTSIVVWRAVARAVEWPSVRLDRLSLWAWRHHHDAVVDRERDRTGTV
ncbi:MAG TPA: hypothetical protein VGH94_12825 [Acidimicrobiales bacterium]|jgi:hypothetical protein